MNRMFALAISLLPVAAHAEVKLCVIDAQTALNETAEGKSARSKLESTFSAKQAQLQQMGKDLEKQFADYEARKMILSESARKDQETLLLTKQQELQGKMMEAEQEMQEMYANLLSGMEEKLFRSAAAIAATKACTVLLPKEATIYVQPGVADLTQDVIKDLDTK
jgi:Skp family chaperone for outer membrane proteins